MASDSDINYTRLFLISSITTTSPATMTKTTTKTTLSPNVVLKFNVFVYVILLSRYTALVFLDARMVNAINLLIGEWFYFEQMILIWQSVDDVIVVITSYKEQCAMANLPFIKVVVFLELLFRIRRYIFILLFYVLSRQLIKWQLTSN